MDFISEEKNLFSHGIKVRSKGLNLLVGAGVGGTSLVYNTITLQPNREDFDTIFDRSFYGSSFGDTFFGTYYPRAKQVLNPSPIPADILATSFYNGSREYRDQAIKAGYPLKHSPAERSLFPMPLATDWDVVRGELAGTKVSSAIEGQVWFGSNSDYKHHLVKSDNYLGQALASGLITLRDLSEVIEITYDSSAQVYVLSVNSLRESDGIVLTTYNITAKHLFLCAGAVYTTALLVRARDKGDLPTLSPQIGQNFGGNGDGFGALLVGKDISAGQGGPAGFAVYDFDANGKRVSLQDLPISFTAGFDTFPNTAKALLTMGQIQNPLGNFTYIAAEDTVEIRYDPQAGQIAYNKWIDVADKFVASNPGTTNGFGTLEATDLISGHPLGGVVYREATDAKCRVLGAPGRLYAIDGSLIPGWAGGINPSLTIAAFSEFCIDRIITADFSAAASLSLPWIFIGLPLLIEIACLGLD